MEFVDIHLDIISHRPAVKEGCCSL